MLRCMARVAPVFAKFSRVSWLGMEVERTEVRVRTTDCTTLGMESSVPRAAAAAAKAGTPGMMVVGILRACSRSICSKMAP